MKDFSKYQGIIPAFYACYDKEGRVDGGAWPNTCWTRA